MSSTKKLLLALIPTLSALLLCGCRSVHTPAVFGYVSCDARFEVEFPSRTDTVICSVERKDGTLSLTVVTPERSADLRVISSPDRCVIIPKDGGDGIPLSSRASEGLTEVFALLYRGSDGSESISRSADGQSTVITYPDGCVTVGADMLPSSVEIIGDCTRTVTISGYTVVSPEE